MFAMKKLAVLVALLLTAGCSGLPGSTPSPTAFDVKGTLTLRHVEAFAAEGDACSGDGGYSDISAGAQVKVSDNAGKVVGLGNLGAGTAHKSASWGNGGTDQCVFEFTVLGVPIGGEAIYGVEVTHRGVIQFTRDQADQVELTLG